MERPIIFNTEMVKAILEGRKTQTRRVLKINGKIVTHPEERIKLQDDGVVYFSLNSMSGPYKCPYSPGDILWVRETWSYEEYNKDCGEPEGYLYKADYVNDKESEIYRLEGIKNGMDIWKWRPSIHIPRKAARIFLKVKNVWVKRLQDITEEDAKAEGVEWLAEISAYKNYLWHGSYNVPKNLIELWPYQYSGYSSARDSFSSLWQLLYAKRGYGWETNPWVWVIEFEKLK